MTSKLSRARAWLTNAWQRFDGPLAVICFGGTMLFAGFIAGSLFSSNERALLVATIKDARADGIRECNAAWAETYARQNTLLTQQQGLLNTATGLINRVDKKTDAIAKRQEQTNVNRNSDVKAAAKQAASEVAAAVENENRRKINRAVRGQ